MNKLLLSLLFAMLFLRGAAQDYDLSDGIYFDGEPYLAIDPHNAEHIIVAWIGFTPGYETGIKVKVSWDGGNSWSASTFLPHISTITHSADPSLQFDTAGYLYACYIDFHQPDSGYVCVCRSPDGGLSWGPAHKVIGAYSDGLKMPVDRPWFAINPVNNHFYVTTKPAPWILPPNRPYFSVSTDTGATWTWRYLDTTSYLTGPDIAAPMATPAVGSDGVLRIIYPTYLPSQNVLPGYLLASSTSDGATFSYQTVDYSAVGVPPSSDSLAKVGYHLAIDPTNPSHLLFDFINNKYGDLDVFTTESTNAGATWSSWTRVNDDSIGNGKMQDLPWCGFDGNGDIIAGWRDRRNAPGPGYQQPAEIWGAIKRTDSATFSPNFKISDTLAPFNATYLDTSGNDFMCIALHNDTMYSVWGDVRTGALNIWFVRRGMGSGSVTDIRLLTDEAVAAVSVYPQPAHDQLYFKGEQVTGISITDLQGRAITSRTLKEQSMDISFLPPGAYIIHMNTATGSATQRFVKE